MVWGWVMEDLLGSRPENAQGHLEEVQINAGMERDLPDFYKESTSEGID